MPERDKAARHCSVQLPDGTSCVVAVQAGLSIKEVLAGLCERHSLNGAAVDLFLVGGDKVHGVCPGAGVPAGLSVCLAGQSCLGPPVAGTRGAALACGRGRLL